MNETYCIIIGIIALLIGAIFIPAISGLIGMYLDLKKNIPYRGIYWGIGIISGFLAGLITAYGLYLANN